AHCARVEAEQRRHLRDQDDRGGEGVEAELPLRDHVRDQQHEAERQRRRHEGPADAVQRPPRHAPSVGPELGHHPPARGAHSNSARALSPRAISTKKIRVHWTNENASNASIPPANPAVETAHAVVRSLTAPTAPFALRMSFRTPPRMNHRAPMNPMTPIETRLFIHWSSKMIGAPVLGSVITPAPPTFSSAVPRTRPVPSPCPKAGACPRLRRPGVM